MLQKYFFSLFVVSISTLFAKPMIDCRVGTGEILECNPYGKRFHIAHEISYDHDKKTLIVVKTLPAPEKHTVEIISVQEMMDRYIHFDETLVTYDEKSKPEKLAAVKESKKPALMKKSVQTPIKKKPTMRYGTYTIVAGDSLSRIAYKFGLSTNELVSYNDLNKESTLRIGQKLKLPYDQTVINAFKTAQYKVKQGDTLISIAKKFNRSTCRKDTQVTTSLCIGSYREEKKSCGREDERD